MPLMPMPPIPTKWKCCCLKNIFTLYCSGFRGVSQWEKAEGQRAEDADKGERGAGVDGERAVTHGDGVGAGGDGDAAHIAVDFVDSRGAAVDGGAPTGIGGIGEHGHG